jgi:serine acetyltransferase
VYVMKGVTIGEGAIIAANSVVMTNVPPYSLAVGNPAEVMFRNYGRPSTYRKPPPNPSTGPGEDHQRKMAAPQE